MYDAAFYSKINAEVKAMILDITVVLILIIPMAAGLYRGFIYSAVHALSWVAAVTAAVFLNSTMNGMLQDSFIGETVTSVISDKVNTSVTALDAAISGMPDLIRGGLASASETTSDIFAEMLAAMVISVISFLIIIFLVKLVLRVLVRPAARLGRDSVISHGDKLLGMIAGGIQGLLLVFVFLALLVPFINLVSDSAAASTVNALQNSAIAGTLYDNNLLLLVTGGIFS